MKEEQELEEITEQQFKTALLQAKKIYLEDINEFTKLFYGCEDIEKHINYLQCNNYMLKFYRNKDGGITYDYKEKQPVGFRGNK